MSRSAPSLSEKIYRLLLRAYPAGFREDFGDELRQQFRDECRDRPGPPARIRLWAEVVPDLALSAFREHLADLAADIRYGARMLLRHPGSTCAAVAALVLGIGANTAVFSVVNAVLLRPLPFPDSGRLAGAAIVDPHLGATGVTLPEFVEWRRRSHAFELMAAYMSGDVNLSGGGEPARVQCAWVSPEFFPLLKASAALGRTFHPRDASPRAPGVAVVSHGIWERLFARDPALIGKSLRLDNESLVVIGVMPRAFNFLEDGTDIWRPLVLNPARPAGGMLPLARVFARLKPGIAAGRARSDLQAIHNRMDARSATRISVHPLQEELTRAARPSLLALFAAVTFILLIACANLANLLLAGAAARQKEFLIRAAIGAARVRIVRQLLIESLMLALLGGGLGILVAHLALPAIVAAGPQTIPRLHQAAIDPTVLGFAAFVSLLAAVLFGTAPALAASRVDLNDALKNAVSGSAASGRTRTVRQALVVAEVALAAVLLTGAVLALRSLWSLQSVPPGFNAGNLLSMTVLLSPSAYAQPGRQAAFWQQVLDRIARVPGVASAAVTSWLPITDNAHWWTATLEGRPDRNPPRVGTSAISADFFRALGVPLRKGRLFNERDTAQAPGVAIINEAMARRFFAGEDPVGKRIRLGAEVMPWLTVIGVVADIRHKNLETTAEPETYVPYLQYRWLLLMNVVVRTDSDPEPLIAALRRQVTAVDRSQPVFSIDTMESRLAAAVAPRRFQAALLGSFAALALVLALVGIYSLISCVVSQRRREIGIRMAMGAAGADVLRLVMAEGIKLAAAGLALGIPAALALSRLLRSLLYAVGPADPASIVTAASLLLAAAMLACYVPGRRAAALDPVEALRDQ